MLCASNAMMFNLFIFHLEEYMNTLEVENQKFTPEVVNLKLKICQRKFSTTICIPRFTSEIENY